MESKLILKCLVGSRAHGVHSEDSDYDYRGVYLNKTSDILSLNHKYKGNHWLEGEEDNTSYEIGHFLQLATKSNPTILEVLKAPIIEATEEGYELIKLFPYLWNPNDAFNAFTGYGHNQRKKFLEKKDGRSNKYAIAWIRTLYNLQTLLSTDDFSIVITDSKLKSTLNKYRSGDYTFGEVVDEAEKYYMICEDLAKKCTHVSSPEKANEFLLKVRKSNW